MTSARELYTSRLQSRQQAASRLSVVDRQVANLRLLDFALVFAVAYGATYLHLYAPAWIWLPILVFLALLMWHQRVLEALARAQRAVTFYQEGLLRLDEAWLGHGVQGEAFRDTAHPYAADLDIFGPGSIFELVCTARTRPGERRLAGWLLAPASPDVVRERQAAVAELAERVDLREDLAVLSAGRGLLSGEGMQAWGEAPRRLPGAVWRWLAALLAVPTVVACVYWLAGNSIVPLAVMVTLEQVLLAGPGQGTAQVMGDVRGPLKDLETLARYLARLEQESFTAPLLTRVAAGLSDRPSQHVARLMTLVQYLDAHHNLAFKPIGSMLMWSMQFSYAIENWRGVHGPRLQGWLDLVAEMEALLSFATYRFEHPDDVFAELVESGVQLAGEGLGHPLLPQATCVRNDVRIDDETRVYIVSGSNMSGKSSYLRTIGTNVVLALAGAPVRARRLQLCPLQVGASLLVSDSLREGISRFYAEIRRLRQIVDMAGQAPPLLFLLDEMLQGTNSYDRGIGATAVITALAARDAVGLVTTHDLNLTHIADAVATRAVNVHFEDHLEGGDMKFDYRLRPGVVEKSNAVALMRAVGLPV